MHTGYHNILIYKRNSYQKYTKENGLLKIRVINFQNLCDKLNEVKLRLTAHYITKDGKAYLNHFS